METRNTKQLQGIKICKFENCMTIMKSESLTASTDHRGEENPFGLHSG